MILAKREMGAVYEVLRERCRKLYTSSGMVNGVDSHVALCAHAKADDRERAIGVGVRRRQIWGMQRSIVRVP